LLQNSFPRHGFADQVVEEPLRSVDAVLEIIPVIVRDEGHDSIEHRPQNFRLLLVDRGQAKSLHASLGA
jgi:hypothetical protein